MRDVGRFGQACVVVQRADDYAANARKRSVGCASTRIREIFHLPGESAREPLFRMFEFREFVSRHHAAEIEAQLLGSGFHPYGVRPSSHVLILPYLSLSGEQDTVQPRRTNNSKREPGELLIAPQSADLVRIDFEDGEELGQLQEIVHFFCQMQQLQISAAIFDAGIRTDQFADPGAVDVVDVREVQQDERTLLFQQLANGLSQQRAAFAQRNSPADIDDGHSGSFTIRGAQCHLGWAQDSLFGVAFWLLPLRPALPGGGNLLDIMISAPPVRPGITSNSSIKARIRKMPRPDVLNRFSWAKGSGTPLRSKPFPSSKT